MNNSTCALQAIKFTRVRERPSKDEFMDYGFDISCPEGDVKYVMDATTCGLYNKPAPAFPDLTHS